jgi:hypothetical protein
LFAGRKARRYVVTYDRDRNKAEYFIDVVTGLPLGSRDRGVIYTANPERDPDTAPTGHITSVTTVEALEELPDTPENRAKLRSGH